MNGLSLINHLYTYHHGEMTYSDDDADCFPTYQFLIKCRTKCISSKT